MDIVKIYGMARYCFESGYLRYIRYFPDCLPYHIDVGLYLQDHFLILGSCNATIFEYFCHPLFERSE